MLDRLLDLKVPSHRQAYSDRTAFLMARLARAAYIHFDPCFPTAASRAEFVATVRRHAEAGREDALQQLLDATLHDPDSEHRRLTDELSTLRLRLVDTVDAGGTQAIVVRSETFVALAFRGTEANRFEDVRADTRARLEPCASGGRVHAGFRDAFEIVHAQLARILDDEALRDLPLFVTGHSLGGALATLASKRLRHPGGIAACYTFGSPRVGDDEWISTLKDPVHRIVNAADCVSMLPPEGPLVELVGWALAWIPTYGARVREWLRANYCGYQHCGNMRYLTDCPTDDFEGVRLLYSVSGLYRLKGWILKHALRRLLADHCIDVYCRKLEIIAERRNPPSDGGTHAPARTDQDGSATNSA